MTRSLIIRPEAEGDLAEGRDWYDARQDGLGTAFLTVVDEVLEHICQSPALYATSYKSVRRVRMKRFPYVVYYRIIGQGVEVLAVLHGSRGPNVWKSRAS
ncbi:MAG: type II toxin-antitoxin system RelE/ParE family toxin [Planctomycetaceae bacterium]|nr:type II toxin-antitoxin system RelE/ParE family toxin [Planctomycetaceae bacterium]